MTVRVITTVEGSPSIIVVCVVVMVSDSSSVEVVTSVWVAVSEGEVTPRVELVSRQQHHGQSSFPNSHPMPWHMYPGMQQPPPSEAGQLTALLGQSPIPPPQSDPC